MNRRVILWISVLLAALLLPWVAGCKGDVQSRGFALPAGDATRGREVFVRLECGSCHSVKGAGLPQPVADPPVGVDLGGVVLDRRTDGELVTAIIDPGHEISPRWAGGTMETGGQSRMADYSDLLTVRDLVDVVAFLRSQSGEQTSDDRG